MGNSIRVKERTKAGKLNDHMYQREIEKSSKGEEDNFSASPDAEQQMVQLSAAEQRLRQINEAKNQFKEMTGSIGTIKEKDASAITEQIMREELAREVRDGEYKETGKVIVERTASLSEPIEKKPENKAQKKLNRQVRSKYNAAKKKLKNDPKSVERKSIGPMNAWSFTQGSDQYDELKEVKSWMVDGEVPEAYEKNKSQVDAMYKDLYITESMDGMLANEQRYYKNVYDSINPEQDGAMLEEVERRLELLKTRREILKEHIIELGGSLSQLLNGFYTDITSRRGAVSFASAMNQYDDFVDRYGAEW